MGDLPVDSSTDNRIFTPRLVIILLFLGVIPPIIFFFAWYFLGGIPTTQLKTKSTPAPRSRISLASATWRTAYVKENNIYIREPRSEKENLLTDKEGRPVNYDIGENRELSFSSSGRYLVWHSYRENTLSIFDLQNKQLDNLKEKKTLSFTLSKTAEKLALVQEGSGEIEILDLETRKTVNSIRATGAHALSFSPDNTHLLLQKVDKKQPPPAFIISALSVSSNSEKQLVTVHGIISPQWLPDGDGLIAAEGSYLFKISLNSAQREALANISGHIVALSPVTKQNTLVVALQNDKLQSLYIFNIKTGGLRKIVDLKDFTEWRVAPRIGVLTDDIFWIAPESSFSQSEKSNYYAQKQNVWAVDPMKNTREEILTDVSSFTFSQQ